LVGESAERGIVEEKRGRPLKEARPIKYASKRKRAGVSGEKAKQVFGESWPDRGFEKGGCVAVTKKAFR